MMVVLLITEDLSLLEDLPTQVMVCPGLQGLAFSVTLLCPLLLIWQLEGKQLIML